MRRRNLKYGGTRGSYDEKCSSKMHMRRGKEKRKWSIKKTQQRKKNGDYCDGDVD